MRRHNLNLNTCVRNMKQFITARNKSLTGFCMPCDAISLHHDVLYWLWRILTNWGHHGSLRYHITQNVMQSSISRIQWHSLRKWMWYPLWLRHPFLGFLMSAWVCLCCYCSIRFSNSLVGHALPRSSSFMIIYDLIVTNVRVRLHSQREQCLRRITGDEILYNSAIVDVLYVGFTIRSDGTRRNKANHSTSFVSVLLF